MRRSPRRSSPSRHRVAAGRRASRAGPDSAVGDEKRSPEGLPLRFEKETTGSASGDLAHVFGRWSLLTLNEVELHGFTLGERLEAATRDGAVVDKAVLVPSVWRDESEPLRVIEPLHFAGRTHVPLLKEPSTQHHVAR